MNRYIMIRRLRGPAILLLAGIILLLHEADLVEFWGLFLPLLLILIGVLKLAERAALAAAGDEAFFPGGPYPYGATAVAATAPPVPGSAIVPTQPQEFGKGTEGGQS
jgi:phosphatidylserine synthase